MHHETEQVPYNLSIPVTWDFSMHPINCYYAASVMISFNSRYLGFFHAPMHVRKCSTIHAL